MDILGVKVNNLSKQEILRKVEDFLAEEKFHQIATVNSEFILKAQKDGEFKNVLSNTDLNIVDGSGISFAFFRHGKSVKYRLAGVDLMNEILKKASRMKLGIFLVAGSGGLSSWEETRDAILKKHPNLEIRGVNTNPHDMSYQSVIGDYEVVFCNFGAPYQEKFLNGIKGGKIRLAMGVGGSFDFITGRVKRAPVFMQKVGLEWLWRFIQQPRRIRRIFNSVIVFPIRVIASR